MSDFDALVADRSYSAYGKRARTQSLTEPVRSIRRSPSRSPPPDPVRTTSAASDAFDFDNRENSGAKGRPHAKPSAVREKKRAKVSKELETIRRAAREASVPKIKTAPQPPAPAPTPSQQVKKSLGVRFSQPSPPPIQTAATATPAPAPPASMNEPCRSLAPPSRSQSRALPAPPRALRTLSSPAKLPTTQRRRESLANDDDDDSDFMSFMRPDVLYRDQSATLAATAKSKPTKRALTASINSQNAPSSSLSSADSTQPMDTDTVASTSEQPLASFTSNNPAVSEIDYILDGCMASDVSLRHNSSIKLVHAFHSHRTRFAQSHSLHEERLFFLMRAHGGFDRLCAAFSGRMDEPLMALSFVLCFFIASRDRTHAPCLTPEAAQMIARIIHDYVDSGEVSDCVRTSSGDCVNLVQSQPVNRTQRNVRSRRKANNASPPPSSTDELKALVANDPLLTALGRPVSSWLLTLLTVASWSTDARVKSLLSTTTIADDLASLTYRAFNDLLSEPNDSHRLFLQLSLMTLENLSHSQPLSQNRAIDASISLAPGQSAVVEAKTFPALFFAILTHFTERVLAVSDEPRDDSDSGGDSGDEHEESAMLARVPSDSILVVLLCRLLVNLTNQNSKGCGMLYRHYQHNLTGIQIIANIAGVCWYHPRLRTQSQSPSPSLNWESDLVDLLTLSLAVIINIAEQSSVIREVLLESCRLTVTQSTNIAFATTANGSDSDNGAIPVGLLAAMTSQRETVEVTWVDLMVDIFAQTLSTVSASQPPTISATDTDSDSEARKSLVARMIGSYAAMNLAILATHDTVSFTAVQQKLRARPENQEVSHRAISPTPRILDARSPSPPRSSTPLILSMRLICRLLNDFLTVHSASGSMSDEALDSLSSLITSLERKIREDSVF